MPTFAKSAGRTWDAGCEVLLSWNDDGGCAKVQVTLSSKRPRTNLFDRNIVSDSHRAGLKACFTCVVPEGTHVSFHHLPSAEALGYHLPSRVAGLGSSYIEHGNGPAVTSGSCRG